MTHMAVTITPMPAIQFADFGEECASAIVFSRSAQAELQDVRSDRLPVIIRHPDQDAEAIIIRDARGIERSLCMAEADSRFFLVPKSVIRSLFD